jgi:4'-phosphopantetheinyl transferase
MNVIPQRWSWQATPPSLGWLGQCPPDLPVVWAAWLADGAAYPTDLASLLSADERARRERLKVPADRQRFLLGRGLLRLLAGAQLNLPPDRVELHEGPFGKPFIVPPPGEGALHFNISHSGQLVLLAFHRAREVGVDVEQVQPGHHWEDIAQRVFSPQEHQGLLALNPDERDGAFFQAWTRHEARLKTLGLGFTDARHAGPETQVTCCDLEMPEGYRGAVAFL